jgi:hypothetical protein
MQLKFIDHENILYQTTNMELLVSESSMAVNKLSFSNTATNIKWPLGLTLVRMEKVQTTFTSRFRRECFHVCLIINMVTVLDRFSKPR